MPWLPFFIDDWDKPLLLDWLGAEPEVAFLLPAGRGCWRAVKRVQTLADGDYALWHSAGGPLPLLQNDGRETPINDPWAGWREQRAGFDSAMPYFGAGHSLVFTLHLWGRHQPYSLRETTELAVLDSRWTGLKDRLSVSSFEWIGNHYRKAPAPTQRWWNRLKSWLARSAVKLQSGRQAFWAFPSALARLRAGIDLDANGFDLSAALRAVPQ